MLAVVLLCACALRQERSGDMQTAPSAAQPVPRPAPQAGATDGARSPSPALIAEWNRQVLAIAEAEDRFLTLKGLHTATMMHLAMHDALNAVSRRYDPYVGGLAPSGAADPVVAAAKAARDVAVSQYPGQAARFDALYARALADAARSPAGRAGTELGVSVGAKAAAAILAARRDDGWDGEADYAWHPMAPGVYAEFNEHSGTPEGFVFGAGWAAATPFALTAPDQFRAPPPPAIASDAYARAYREVKSVGATRSSTRTADQGHMAMWWKDFVENSHNRLARELARQDGLDLWRSARLFALLDMAIYDAYVNVFDNKFHYNHWRPYTAIRWASHDGNPETEEDPRWNNLHRHTYAFPSYPSAHGAACGAASVVLADSFGSERAFAMTTHQVDRAGPLSDKIPMRPATRRFGSFAAAADECGISRVYLGIHFRYDSVQGVRLGRKVGRHVVDGLLTPAGG